MAEYKTIKGFKTQSYATDPVAATAAWSSGDVFKYFKTNRCYSTYSANQCRTNWRGRLQRHHPYANTEQYDGTAWSQVNDMLFARFGIGGTGTQTNAIGAGGFVSPPGYQTLSESWDGTCWTEGNNIPYGKVSSSFSRNWEHLSINCWW